MRILRFLDDENQLHAGIDRGDNTADLLPSPDLLRGPLQPTGRQVAVRRLIAPIHPANIFCIGLNYRAHAKETGADLPEYPVLFMKPTSALNHPHAPIHLPASQLKGPEVDFECELAVVIGREGKNIPESRALDHVLGYTIANDVSARRWQKQAGGGQWIRGKSFDSFCPLGPALLTPDSLPDPQDLPIQTRLNGQTVQQSHTSDMIFSVVRIIAFLSRDTTLLPGTVILTGTPEGVGVARTPPLFLNPGDQLELTIDPIGTLANPVAHA